jgi:hypothetical protein
VVASSLNNDVARAASLIAVAVLPAAAGLTGTSYLHPAEFTVGFHRASLIAAGLCVIGGVLAAVFIRNPRSARVEAAPVPGPLHCSLDAPPARVLVATPPADRAEAPS